MFSNRVFSDEVDNKCSDRSIEDMNGSFSEFQLEEGFENPVHSYSKSFCQKEYVTHISASRASDSDVALALSNGSLKVLTMKNGDFDISFEVKNTSKHIVELKFDNFNNNLLWTADHNGIISLWDIRIPRKASMTFTDTTDDKEDKDKKFNSFDVSTCGKLLCAGTNKFDDDSYILFWDIRKKTLAGGFWESHTDDITQVKFHPSETAKLFSASTDGLINVYDLTQSSEEDALIDTLNTESSVEKICCAEFGHKNILSCITHTADIQFWKNEDVQPFVSLKRDEITQLLQRKSETYPYIVDIHRTDDSFLVIAGTTENDGECVRGFKLEKSSLKPSFGLYKNKQTILCSAYNENTKLLVTGGEKGILDAWKLSNIL